MNRPEAFQLPLTLQIDTLPLQGEVDVIPWTETHYLHGRQYECSLA